MHSAQFLKPSRRNGLAIFYMKAFLAVFIALLTTIVGVAQTKIGGKVVDEEGNPIPYVNVIFSDSHEGTITDEHGKFYLESEQHYNAVEFSFLGYETETITLRSSTTRDLKIV